MCYHECMLGLAPLELKNVTKSYGKSRGIEDVSFALTNGEVFGFLGPNGAGKTTTIRAILNFIKPTSGQILVFGQDSIQKSVQIKSKVGYLAGNASLYPNQTGGQLLAFLGALQGEVDQGYVAQLAEHFQADLDRPIKQLSKGNQQKIGLIQAFMHQPSLIILDEPTSGLDPLMQERFYQMVYQAKSGGATLLISSHNLAEVQRICDRAAFIKEGKLVSVEDIANLKHLAVNHFTVNFASMVKPGNFKNINGLSDFRLEKRTGYFTIHGRVDDFIKTIAKYSVESIEVNQASLEDIFMRLYQSEESP